MVLKNMWEFCDFNVKLLEVYCQVLKPGELMGFLDANDWQKLWLMITCALKSKIYGVIIEFE